MGTTSLSLNYLPINLSCTRMIDDPWNKKGSQSLQGEVDKNGIMKVTIFAAVGPEESKGQISNDGNKIVIDNGIRRLTLTRK